METTENTDYEAFIMGAFYRASPHHAETIAIAMMVEDYELAYLTASLINGLEWQPDIEEYSLMDEVIPV